MAKDEDDKDHDELADIFHDLGRDFSKLLDQLAQQGEHRWDEFQSSEEFGNLDDLDDFREMFDLNNFQDFVEQFSSGQGSFGGFETDRQSQSGTRKDRTQSEQHGPRSPHVDLFEEDDKLEIFVELPGVELEDIQIDRQDTKLRITANHQPRSYAKEIQLPTTQLGAPSKRFNNGILHLTYPKQ